jgi:hypothetical protein
MTFIKMTLSMMIFRLTTLSIMTLCIMLFRLATLGKLTLSMMIFRLETLTVTIIACSLVFRSPITRFNNF